MKYHHPLHRVFLGVGLATHKNTAICKPAGNGCPSPPEIKENRTKRFFFRVFNKVFVYRRFFRFRAGGKDNGEEKKPHFAIRAVGELHALAPADVAAYERICVKKLLPKIYSNLVFSPSFTPAAGGPSRVKFSSSSMSKWRKKIDDKVEYRRKI